MMPTKAPTPCRVCGKATNGECCRPSANKRGYNRSWNKCRKLFLGYFPLCQDHLAKGETVPATQVHHIQKMTDAPELSLDFLNLMALCATCHSKRTAKGE
jgi:5-methylcytosine-specific restriction protein A